MWSRIGKLRSLGSAADALGGREKRARFARELRKLDPVEERRFTLSGGSAALTTSLLPAGRQSVWA
jgi:hypothetical protein